MALTGRLDGSFLDEFDPPVADDLPAHGFDRGAAGFVAPADRPDERRRRGAPGSDRLELLEPFPPWDGHDIRGLRVLLKAVGKCTTDHISPAGKWLKYRGHLTNISRNLFLGANNAFTDASRASASTRATARSCRCPTSPARTSEPASTGSRSATRTTAKARRGARGDGAALTWAGARCSRGRSPRIAEANLKKQGVLPLTFADPPTTTRSAPTTSSTSSVCGTLAPGSTVKVVLHHADGTTDDDRGEPHDVGRAHRLVPRRLGAQPAGGATLTARCAALSRVRRRRSIRSTRTPTCPSATGRPAVRLNMIVSVDGGTSWGGVSGALGGPADKSLFAILRSLADRRARRRRHDARRGLRPRTVARRDPRAARARGQTPVPPIAVVSRSCRLDWDTPFFTDAEERPLVITVTDADAAAPRAGRRGRRRDRRRRRRRRLRARVRRARRARRRARCSPKAARRSTASSHGPTCSTSSASRSRPGSRAATPSGILSGSTLDELACSRCTPCTSRTTTCSCVTGRAGPVAP